MMFLTRYVYLWIYTFSKHRDYPADFFRRVFYGKSRCGDIEKPSGVRIYVQGDVL